MESSMKQNFYPLFGLGLVLFSATLDAWTPGVAISQGASSANPTPSYLAIDQSSNAIAGWLQGNVGTDLNLYTSSLPSAALSWSSPVQLYAGASPDYPTFPVLSAAGQGGAVAAWANFQSNGSAINQTTLNTARGSIYGTGWSGAATTNPINGYLAGGSYGADEEGNQCGLLAITTDSTISYPPYAIQFQAFAINGWWISPINLGTDNGPSGPVLFTGAWNGQALLAWRSSYPLVLESATYTFGSNQVEPIGQIPLPEATIDVGFIRGSIAENGDAVVVYGARIGYGGNYVLYASFLPKGSSAWSFPEAVSDPAHNTNGTHLSVETDLKGNATILWGEWTEANTIFVRATNLAFGADAVDAVYNLTDPAGSNTASTNSFMTVQEDSFGNAIAVWHLYVNGGTPTVQAATKPAGGAWSAAASLTATGVSPRAALSDQGTAVVTWVDTNTGLMMSSHDNHLFPVNSPKGFYGYTVEDADGSFLLKMHWTPSKAPHLVNYEIFQDGVLVGSVAANGPFEFTQQVSGKPVSSIYTLVAYASNGNKSAPIKMIVTP
jgi:hypothetical protein